MGPEFVAILKSLGYEIKADGADRMGYADWAPSRRERELSARAQWRYRSA